MECHYARKNNYTLLTGDMNLRKVAIINTTYFRQNLQQILSSN